MSLGNLTLHFLGYSAGVVVVLFVLSIQGAQGQVTLLGSDAGGTSSFNSANYVSGTQGWSNDAAPAPGSTYTDNDFELRSPTTSTSYTFGGDALTINGTGNGATTGSFVIKSSGATYTINSLTLNGAYILANSGSVGTSTVTGSNWQISGLNVFSGGSSNSGLTIDAAMSGTGSVALAGGLLTDSAQLVIAGANTYTGTTYLTASSGNLVDIASTGIIAGNLTFSDPSLNANSGGGLELDSSSALGPNTLLTLNGTKNLVYLDYNGIDIIDGLTNGTTTLGTGTYTAAQLNTDFGGTIFSNQNGDTGEIEIMPESVPEPSTWALFAGGLVLLGVAHRARLRLGSLS